MKSTKLRRLILCGSLPVAAVAGFAAATTSSAASAGEPTERTLELLCESRNGEFFDTPLDVGRCQAARPRRNRPDPLAAERTVCADKFAGTLRSAPSSNAPKRVTWVCS